MTIAEDKYVNCIRCGYIVSGLMNESFACSVDCLECGAKAQFGPDIYVKDYAGRTLTDAMRVRREKQRDHA